MGDIDLSVKDASLSSFADDTRLTMKVSSESDIEKMQADLNSVYEWSKQNNMMFNNTKFELLQYGKDLDLKSKSKYKTTASTQIQPKTQTKDLGILMTDDATFKSHINKIVENTKQLTSWILRVFRSRSPEVLLPLWKSLVIPRLEYSSQLWSPASKGQIKVLEALQWSYLKKINCVHRMTYNNALKQLKLYSLQRRRERYQAIYSWKIAEGIVPNLHPPMQTHATQRKGRLFQLPPVLNNSTSFAKLHNSFRYQAPRTFNALPKSLRSITSCPVLKFKTALDKFLKTLPDEPPIPGTNEASENSIVTVVRSNPHPPLFRDGVEEEEEVTDVGRPRQA